MINNQISVELTSSLSGVDSKDLPKILISSPGYESKEIIIRNEKFESGIAKNLSN